MNNDFSIIAVSTETKKAENQDFADCFIGDSYNAVFLADGLGSYKYAKKSSEIVVNFFKEKAELMGSSESVKNSVPSAFQQVYKEAKQKLIDYANETFSEEERKEDNLLGTTAITLVETENRIKIAYVGNGAIWHIRGNFNEFPESYLFPWNAINILNPHTIPEKGKEALYKLISDSADFNESMPSVIEIDKDKVIGDIIMICTDGIFSADQVKAGKNDKGIWVKYENSMMEFFKHISHYFKTATLYDNNSLLEIIKLYLAEIKPTLDDDATIAVLLTKEVLAYQKNKLLVTDESNISQ